MSIAIPVNGTPPAQTYHAHRNFIDNLKTGTCLTSSWFVIAASGMATLLPWGNEGKLIMTALFFGAMVALKKGLDWSRKRRPSQNFFPWVEGAPSALRKVVEDVSHNLGLEKAPGVFWINSLKSHFTNGFATDRALYISKKFYKRMSEEQREFVAAHEIVHIEKKDSKRMGPMEEADISSLSAAPGLFVSAFSYTISAGASLPLAIAAMYGATIAAIGLFAFNRAMHYRHNVAFEFRADRLAVAATGNPIGAISFISEHAPEAGFQKPKFFPEDTYHPRNRDRILRIVDDFNNANPESAIMVSGRNFGDTPGEYTRLLQSARVLFLDATKFNGKSYTLYPWGLYHDKAAEKLPETPEIPPEIGSGQPLPNPV